MMDEIGELKREIERLKAQENPAQIPILTADPTTPYETQAWVLKQNIGGGGTGTPMGLLLLLTKSMYPTYSYEICVYIDGAPRRAMLA